MKKLSKRKLIKLLKTDIGTFNQYREDTDWDYIYLGNVDLRCTNLNGADLYHADLYGANLRGANLFGVDLNGADLRLVDLSNTNLFGANLNGANLSGTVLGGAVLSGTDLRFANLRQAILNDTNLSDADLSGADLSGAVLRRAILNDTKGLLSNEDLLDKYFDKAERNHFVKAEYNHWMVYKAFGNTMYPQPDSWRLEPGSIIEEINLNENRKVNCGSGVNFATLEWVEENYFDAREIWKCEVDLTCNVIMPYGTDGKGRSKKLKLIKRVK
jgi:uncharacterized protein YjbI with pentapeptide repeats